MTRNFPTALGTDWIDGEAGPQCPCGNPTAVMIGGFDRPYLVCVFHDAEGSVMYPIPRRGRPDQWPNMIIGEMDELITQGEEEQEREDQAL